MSAHPLARPVTSPTQGTNGATTREDGARVDKTQPDIRQFTPADLSDRDWAVLNAIRAFHYLTSRQLARQHFGMSEPTAPVPRRVNRVMGRLRDLGLVATLQRRIGGVRAGSSGLVWCVTNRGSRALEHHFNTPRGSRVRITEPTATFLEHTLAIAETVISVQEATRSGDPKLVATVTEPSVWVEYLGPLGAKKTLKPDLGATTITAGFEDHWFFEVDRDTEPPHRIVTKCLQYQEHRAGVDGLYPAVVWVVPTSKRQTQLRQRLADEQHIDGDLFVVITLAEITDLLRLGAADFKLAMGGQEGGNAS